ncbi:MAG: family 43 glycosylhydrolase [Prolixibacteraceae bacterium]|nr:family 43 glycosylhydrolase [Prolixibacteraceae bacterium]
MQYLNFIIKGIENFNRMSIFALPLFFVIISATAIQAQPPAHDPSAMIKNTDGRYWVFTTGNGVAAISGENTNFDNWRFETPVFPGAYPSWIDTYVTGFGGNFWAPDVIFMNGYYYLYYSASSWGTTKSAIGVARTEKLGTVWTDLGMVVSSNGSSSARNAIDPSLFRDTDGRIWMTYGSFFAGIGLVEIDSITGKTIGGVYQLAGGNHQDIEAPCITKHDNYYYLFVNRGACCNGLQSTYYMRVARSENVKGPYGEWRTFLSSEGRFHGPGHVGLGEGTFTYHFYDTQSNGTARLSISSISWGNGWPVPGTPLSWSNEEGEFIENGEYCINAVHSGMAVEVANNRPAVGANVQQGIVAEENGQIWKLTKVDDNWYKISPKENADLALDVYNISSADGANICLWTYWGGDGQQYKFEQVRDSMYHIVARNSRKCLQVVNASKNDFANIEQSQCDDEAENQLFTLSLAAEYNGIEKPASAKFSIFPNPAKEYISVEIPDGFSEDFTLTFFNQTGQEVLYAPLMKNSKNQLRINELPEGTYIIIIEAGEYIFSETFLKQ